MHILFDLYRCGVWVNTFGKELNHIPQINSWIVYKGCKYQIKDIVEDFDESRITITAHQY